MKNEFSEEVKILPWIGKNYKKSPKILVLGMATYNQARDRRNVVKNMINSLCDGTWTNEKYFWTRTKNVLKEKNEETIDFWNRVSFYEYIQGLVKPKKNISEQNWENANEPFLEVLKVLKPDIIAVIGFLTFNRMKNRFKKGKNITKNGNTMETLECNINKRSVYICKIKHTAAYGFKKDVWRELYFKFIKLWNSGGL